MNTADFKTARRWNALNRFLQIVLAISLALSLNYLASRSDLHRRFEIAPGQSRVLALETRKQIEAIARSAPETSGQDAPWVNIYLTLSTHGLSDPKKIEDVNTILKQLQNLLDDVQFAAARTGRGNWLCVEQTDSLRRAGVLAGLQARYTGIDPNTTVLVVTCKDREKDRCKVISLQDILSTRPGSRKTLFTGEEALASALLSVTGEKPPLVYSITGHREMAPEDTGPEGLSRFDARLRARNILLRPLDLAKVNEVPTDADLVLLPAPKAPVPPAEIEKLRRYMRERNGRIIALINPADPIASLDDLFADWGILVQNARVHDTSPGAFDAQGNLIVRVGIFGAENAALAALAPTDLRLAFAKARPVREDPAPPADDTLRVTRLVSTNPNPPGKVLSWGETNYNTEPWTYDPVRDIEAPVPVAVVAERAAGLRLNLGTSGGRLLVVGSGDIASNARINAYENNFFLLNVTNWMLDRTQFIGIPPHSMDGFQFNATNDDLTRVARWFALLPLIVLFLGLAVFFWRRST